MRTLLKSTTITVSMLMSLISFSQTKREILVEDPKLSPNLRLDISPLNTYMNYDATAGWAVRAAYRHNNKFSISGEYRKEYYDAQKSELDGAGFDYGKPVNGSAMEFTGTYYFKKTEREAKQLLPVKSRSVGYRTIEVTVDPVPLSIMALYGARVGYLNMQGTNGFSNLKMYDKANPSNTVTEYAIPLQKTNMAFAGVSASKIKNIKVNYPGYGVRRKQVIREYYADFMYQVSNNFSPVYDEAIIYEIDKSSKTLPYGFRLGMLCSPTGRIINFGYGLEAGVMPGVESLERDWYLNFRLVVSLFTKVGLKQD